METVNIFVSRPTVIGNEYEALYSGFDANLRARGFVPRRLGGGGGDFSKKPPLKAVIDLVTECRGAIILGYPQIEFSHEARRSDVVESKLRYVFPTPWNHIEGALAYSCQAPILVIAHPGISGGVFDHGITGEGVLHIDLAEPEWFTKPRFTQPFEEWVADLGLPA